MDQRPIYDKTSDNRYFHCPPRMDDGRHFTDYRPSSLVNHMAQSSNNQMSSYGYRQFLIHHGSEIMNANRYYTYMKNGCAVDNTVQELPGYNVKPANAHF